VTFFWRRAAIAAGLICSGMIADAQPPASNAESEVSIGDQTFDPDKYGIVTFENYLDLYDRLTAPGRCPPNEMAEPRQPCAFVFYQPSDADKKAAFGLYFKPVFVVMSKDKIWAIHNKQLRKVSIRNLYFDEPTIRGKPGKYVSVAVIGNAENRANCEAQRGCLSDLAAQDMFLMYKQIPQAVVDVLWGKRMLGPGYVSR
jgi:hypothetical protein